MEILHLDLKPVADNYAELRYFWDNPDRYESRRLSLDAIADLIEAVNEDYYQQLEGGYQQRLMFDCGAMGRMLFNFQARSLFMKKR